MRNLTHPQKQEKGSAPAWVAMGYSICATPHTALTPFPPPPPPLAVAFTVHAARAGDWVHPWVGGSCERAADLHHAALVPPARRQHRLPADRPWGTANRTHRHRRVRGTFDGSAVPGP